MGQQKDMRVFFGVPAYGGMLMAAFVRGYTKLQQQGIVDAVCHIDGDSLVSRARNNLSAEFLKSDCTHLLFIDTDILFEPWQVQRLIDRAKVGLPVVAGLYPKKQHKLAWVINDMEGEDTRKDGLRRVKYAGTGFMLIARSVFERMRNAYPECAYISDHGELNNDAREVRWEFWPNGVWRSEKTPVTEPGRYLSEDWYFCQRCEDLGIPIMMDMSIHVKHIGSVAYPLEDVPLHDEHGNPIPKEKPKKEKKMDADLECPPEMERHIRKIFDGEYIFENPTKDGDLIYDIGANIGGFTAWAGLVWPNSKIVAFEPVEANFRLLERNCGKRDNVKVVQAALSSDPELTTIWHGKNNPGECSLFKGDQQMETSETVQVMDPSTLPPAQFYKIDTEGCELDIIRNLNFSEAKAVVLEWHSEADWHAIKEHFAGMGWILARDDKRARNLGILAFVKNPYVKDDGDDKD